MLPPNGRQSNERATPVNEARSGDESASYGPIQKVSTMNDSSRAAIWKVATISFECIRQSFRVCLSMARCAFVAHRAMTETSHVNYHSLYRGN